MAEWVREQTWLADSYHAKEVDMGWPRNVYRQPVCSNSTRKVTKGWGRGTHES